MGCMVCLFVLEFGEIICGVLGDVVVCCFGGVVWFGCISMCCFLYFMYFYCFSVSTK